MKESFYKIDIEKQDRIINAAFLVFSRYDYNKASTDDIVKKAGISKGLLFHYFGSKKELYLFLYDYSVQFVKEEIGKYYNSQETDFYEILKQTQIEKCKVMKKHPYLYAFASRAYYEKSKEVVHDMDRKNSNLIERTIETVVSRADVSKFKDGVDIKQLMRIIIWCADGFMKEKMCEGAIEIDRINEEFLHVLDNFRKFTYKET